MVHFSSMANKFKVDFTSFCIFLQQDEAGTCKNPTKILLRKVQQFFLLFFLFFFQHDLSQRPRRVPPSPSHFCENQGLEPCLIFQDIHASSVLQGLSWPPLTSVFWSASCSWPPLVWSSPCDVIMMSYTVAIEKPDAHLHLLPAGLALILHGF